MSDSLNEAELWEVVKSLGDASSAQEVRQLLTAQPQMQDRSLEPLLTQQLRHAWRRGEVTKTRDFLAYRTFLRAVWRMGLAQALAEAQFPLARQSGFGRLLQANELPARITWAKQALAELQQETEPEIVAELHVSLAKYLLQSKGAAQSQQREEAVWHSEQGVAMLGALSPHSPDWANACHVAGLANYYRVQGNRALHLQTAVTHFKHALSIFTTEKFPVAQASVQHNLGNAWFAQTDGNRQQNIEQAIVCYEAAQAGRPYSEQPEQWLMTTHQLALAHLERRTGSRMANIEQAVACCEAVLQKCTLETNPGQWGRSQVALGNAFVRRLKGDRTQNIEQAIDCYQKGINVLEEGSEHWAMAHTNLAVAYFWRAAGNKEKNLQLAEENHQRALSVYSKEESPIEWARTLTNLGNLQWHLYTVYNDAAHLQKAVEHLQAAATVRTESQDPPGWALLQHILGNVYADWPGENRYPTLQKAIVCYQKALTVRTQEAAQGLWAETINNLGTAYTDLVFAGYGRYAQEATACYEQALTVHTPETFPFDCRRASRNLAQLLFLRGEWSAAAARFQESLVASEYLYQAGVTPVAREAELKEAHNLPLNAAFCLAKAGRWTEAVAILEKNRARTLGEALALKEAALAAVSAADRADFVAVCGEIATWEAEAREYHPAGNYDFLTVSARLEEARAALTAVIHRIRHTQPDFLPEGLPFAAIQAVAASLDQPLVYLVTTAFGSVALVVPPNSEGMQEEHIIWAAAFNSQALHNILRGHNALPGYLDGVQSSQVDTLKQILSDCWPQLQSELMDKIGIRLRQLGFTQAVLVPTGQLSLLPLHALADELVYSVAPSARSLQNAERCTFSEDSRFLGIGNPQPLPDGLQPLAFAQLEVAEIATQFPEAKQETLLAEMASFKAVEQAQAGTSYLHFACHGSFALKRPLSSALFLAHQEKLTLEQLLNRKLDLSTVQLVVLSACKTGVIEFDKLPDELIGFPAGFLQAGVPAVISTLWAINDVSTFLLMNSFYQYHLADGLPPADALKAAQHWLENVTVDELRKDLRKRIYDLDAKGMAGSPLYRDLTNARNQLRSKAVAERPFAHPYYWASFVYTGP